MTLLEAIVAFVILALVGIACLDLGRGAAQLERSSVEWSRAVSIGETVLASAGANAPLDASAPHDGTGEVEVQRHSWSNGVDRLDVTVFVSAGRTLHMSRLVPTSQRRTADGRGVRQ